MIEKPPVLQLKNINKSFSGVQVLHDVSFDLYAGEVHCLVGENGAGKSTLIKIISGAYHPDTGTIVYQGQTIQHLNPRWSLDHGISTIYQEIDTVSVLSVAENIALGNEPLTRGGNVDRSAMRLRAKKVLDDIGADIDVDAILKMSCPGTGECLQTIAKIITEYQGRFIHNCKMSSSSLNQ